MAADVKWRVSWTSPASFTSNATVLRFKNAPDNNNDNNNPLLRPSSGTNYSYQKITTLWIVSAGGATELSNLKVKLTNTDGTGTELASSLGGNVTCQYKFNASYDISNLSAPLSSPGGTFSEETLVTWGSSPPNHNIGSDGVDVRWGGATPADYLYLQLSIGPGSGGEIPAWNTVAVYHEI